MPTMRSLPVFSLGSRVRIRFNRKLGRVALCYPGGAYFVAIDGERNASVDPCYVTNSELEEIPNHG